MSHRFLHRPVALLALLLLGAGLFFFPTAAEAAFCMQSPRAERPRCRFQRAPVTKPVAPPETFTIPEIPEDTFLHDATYGWVEDYAYFFDKPGPGATPTRTARSGFFYGPAWETVTDENGKIWHNVWGDWLPDQYYHQVELSQFKGVEVNRQPERPFGWVLRPTVPRDGPAGEPLAAAAELPRYHFVEMVDWKRGDDNNTWIDVGPGQWLRYDTVALIIPRPRPGDVGPEDFWIDVDLKQQTFSTYEGDRLVYAGLISSGLSRWPTRVGLNPVWERRELTPMEGGVEGDDYYFIDHVPYNLFYDGEIALHGAFWHDDFGRPKSHGCVNMAPYTAEWVYKWSENAPGQVWVWTHYSNYEEILLFARS